MITPESGEMPPPSPLPRYDLSNRLVHFTKGADDDAAFATLRVIMGEGKLRGSSGIGDGKIRGGYKCVCFTEAPISAIGQLFVQAHAQMGQYRAFGIMVDKRWLFKKGGRPVIYQSNKEFDELPESIRYRHVRLDLSADTPTDLTWEREWRIPVHELAFAAEDITIILPSRPWADRLQQEHFQEQRRRANAAGGLGIEAAAVFMQPFRWHFLTFDGLGLARGEASA